jgi:hypothetical protein
MQNLSRGRPVALFAIALPQSRRTAASRRSLPANHRVGCSAAASPHGRLSCVRYCLRPPVALGWPQVGGSVQCVFWESWRCALRWRAVRPFRPITRRRKHALQAVDSKYLAARLGPWRISSRQHHHDDGGPLPRVRDAEGLRPRWFEQRRFAGPRAGHSSINCETAANGPISPWSG